jgi:DNA-binding transcriptional regulator YhcF (GntR family)
VSAELQSDAEVQPGSAAARAYRHVKDRLLDGRFPGGVLLSENELARELGISRTPVRQAFVQLETEELLDLYPRRGALVRPISMLEAEDVLEARLLIETHCVRRVAAQDTSSRRRCSTRSQHRSAHPRTVTPASSWPIASFIARSSPPIATRSWCVSTTPYATATNGSPRRWSHKIRLAPRSSSPSIARSPARSISGTATARQASSTHTCEALTS